MVRARSARSSAVTKWIAEKIFNETKRSNDLFVQQKSRRNSSEACDDLVQQKSRRNSSEACDDLVRLAGFEPARFPRRILSPLCMPVPPQSRLYYFTRNSAFVNPLKRKDRADRAAGQNKEQRMDLRRLFPERKEQKCAVDPELQKRIPVCGKAEMYKIRLHTERCQKQ